MWPSRFPTKFPFRFGYVSQRPTFLPAAPAAKVIGDTQIVSVHSSAAVTVTNGTVYRLLSDGTNWRSV